MIKKSFTSRIIFGLLPTLLLASLYLIPSSILQHQAYAQSALTTTEFPLPSGYTGANNITSGPDGNLWFTDGDSPSKIGKITPSGVVTIFPTTVYDPLSITAGSDGNLWFTEDDSQEIGRITPAGVVTQFPLPSTLAQPLSIINGPNGNLWFTSVGYIGQITPSGVVTEFPANNYGGFENITLGPDGNLWSIVQPGNIERITPDGIITEFSIPNGDSSYDITSGSDGNIWFTENNANKIGRITPEGIVTEFPLPSTLNEPLSIDKGPDGNLWFTAQTGNIGQITPGGIVTEFSTNTNNAADSNITTGPDGNLWIAAYNNIVRVNLSSATTTPTPTPTPQNYPYANMQCVWSPYATAGTKAEWCKNVNSRGQIISDKYGQEVDDWGLKENNDTPANLLDSTYGYDYRNCTDYVAWKLSTLGVQPAQYKGLGNAEKWIINGPKHGLTVNSTPEVGSAAVEPATGSNPFGHVAFVEKVTPNSKGQPTITVSEFNEHYDGNYDERTGTPSQLRLTQFVHFEKYETTTP